MKCPMCGSDEVSAYAYVRLKSDSLSGWWFPGGSGEIDDKAPANCECGWTGEVYQLEADQQ